MHHPTIERVTLRMLARLGPISSRQLRRLLGMKWHEIIEDLERKDLVRRVGNYYEATNEGQRIAA